MKLFRYFITCILSLTGGFAAHAQAITEGFDNVATLPGSGWTIVNASDPVGSGTWAQGNSGNFAAQNGAANSYVAAGSNSGSGISTISNWLITPTRTFRNGDVITFYTRTAALSLKPDRLQVRMSTSGSSANVGGSATTTGDFTDLLLEINALQALLLYPDGWTQYTITIAGLTAPTFGRVAFRYFVTNGGPSGLNSNYIGIDNFVYTPYVCPAITVSPAALPVAPAGISYNQTITQSGGAAPVTFSVSAGSLPPGLTLSAAGNLSGTPTTPGTYNFTVTATSTLTGCTGSRSYTIVVACNSIVIAPTTLPAAPAGVSYNQTITQSGGAAPVTFSVSAGSLPPGLTLSTAGNLSGTPTTTGTYTFTITATSTSTGCTGSRSYTIAVACGNIIISPATLPDGTTSTAYSQTLSQSGGGSPVIFTLSAGSLPPGLTLSSAGTISGTPTTGGGYSFTITATNSTTGCSGSQAYSISIDCGPGVAALAPFTPVCRNQGPVTLTGGTPVGGTYSGSGVSNGMFDPGMGSQTIVYSYTDGFGCISSASQNFPVNDLSVISFSTNPAVCAGAPAFTLNNASPAGGTYSGTGVSNNMFTPAVGTQTITYTYTDNNGCTASDTNIIVVTPGPVASFDELPAQVCNNGFSYTLTGGTPAGGTYAGTDVSNGVFTPATIGTQNISYTYTDSTGCAGIQTQQVEVVSCPTGVATVQGDNEIQYLVDRDSRTLTIRCMTTGNSAIVVRIMNMQGQSVIAETYAPVRVFNRQYNVAGLPAGMYIIHVQAGGKDWVGKVAW